MNNERISLLIYQESRRDGPGVKSTYSLEENEGLVPSTHTNSSQPITLQFQCIQYPCALSGSIGNSNLIEGQKKGYRSLTSIA